MKKIVSFFILITTITSISFATRYIPSVDPNEANVGQFKVIANTVIASMKWVGYVIAIGMLIYVGIKYTMASADEKASMKGVLVKVVTGSFIIAGASTIVNFVLALRG